MVPAARSSTSFANIGSVTVSDLTVNNPNHTLSFTFTGPGTFDVVDETTGAVLATGVGYVPGGPVSFNGLTLSITGAPNAGDVFRVSNTVTSADAANTGTGAISDATVAAPDPNLTDVVTITFDNPPGTFTVAGATTGTPTVNVPYTSGAPISFNGWTLTLTGTPEAGDVITIEPNTGGVGDNRNALALASLQTTNTMIGGTATYEEAYGQLVAEVGSLTRQADVNRAAQAAVLNESVQRRAQISGVNLDEEAANMLRFQQMYEASAQIITVANQAFDSLLDAVSR